MGEGPWCNRACDQSRGPGSRPRLKKSPASDTGWHGPRQRGTRDTLPLAISGCLAQRYRKCIPASSHSCWTTRNMRKPGLGRG
jgi:hypothetical protein